MSIKSNKIKELVATANKLDKAGLVRSANEVDEQIVALVKKEAFLTSPDMQQDIDGIVRMLTKIKEVREELLGFGPAYLDKLKRMLQAPGLAPEQSAYLNELHTQVASALTGKS